MSQFGMGFMLKAMMGEIPSESSRNAFKAALGKTVGSITLDAERNKLVILFEDQSGIEIYDDGQDCCETRFMTCDDDLAEFNGAALKDMVLKDGPSLADDEVHDTQFVEVVTSKGSFTLVNHNQHNGYYGGFDVAVVAI